MTAPKYPVVFKIGHAHSGYGKVRVETNQDFQVSCFQYHPHFLTLKNIHEYCRVRDTDILWKHLIISPTESERLMWFSL